VIDRELSSIGDNLIAIGFCANNDPYGKFVFDMDDILIKHVDYMWQISDSVHDDARFDTLRELIESDFWRWEDE